MEDHGHVEVLADFPEGIVDGVVPVAVADGVGSGEDALEIKVVAGALDLGNGVVDVFQGDHGCAVESPGALGAEVVEPVVVATGDGGGVGAVVEVDGADGEAAGREEDGGGQALDVHGMDLGLGVEAGGDALGKALGLALLNLTVDFLLPVVPDPVSWAKPMGLPSMRVFMSMGSLEAPTGARSRNSGEM